MASAGVAAARLTALELELVEELLPEATATAIEASPRRPLPRQWRQRGRAQSRTTLRPQRWALPHDGDTPEGGADQGEGGSFLGRHGANDTPNKKKIKT